MALVDVPGSLRPPADPARAAAESAGTRSKPPAFVRA